MVPTLGEYQMNTVLTVQGEGPSSIYLSPETPHISKLILVSTVPESWPVTPLFLWIKLCYLLSESVECIRPGLTLACLGVDDQFEPPPTTTILFVWQSHIGGRLASNFISRMILNFISFCLYLQSAGIIGYQVYATTPSFMKSWGLNLGFCVC